MSDRPYSRHYHDLVDDAKFVEIYPDDHHYACWSRLLIIADQAWPSSAHLPASARKASVSMLHKVGLIDLMADGRYRIHGLDLERRARAGSARVGGLASGRSRSVQRLLNDRSAIAEPEVNLVEKSIEERVVDNRSVDAPVPVEARAPTPRQEVGNWLLARGAGRPSGWVATTLSELIKVYGAPRIISLWESAPGDIKTSKQFTQYAERGLAPKIINGHPASDPMRGIKATQAYLRNLRGETSDERANAIDLSSDT